MIHMFKVYSNAILFLMRYACTQANLLMTSQSNELENHIQVMIIGSSCSSATHSSVSHLLHQGNHC